MSNDIIKADAPFHAEFCEFFVQHLFDRHPDLLGPEADAVLVGTDEDGDRRLEAHLHPGGSGRLEDLFGHGLEPGQQLRWDWEMYGVSAEVRVQAVEPNRRILIEWDDPPCPVEWIFTAREDDTTLVQISNWGFRGSEDEVVAQAIDSKGGFVMVLAGLKALLEHGIALNLVADHHPDAP